MTRGNLFGPPLNRGDANFIKFTGLIKKRLNPCARSEMRGERLNRSATITAIERQFDIHWPSWL